MAYECYECKYEGDDPENICLQPSENSDMVWIWINTISIFKLRGVVFYYTTKCWQQKFDGVFENSKIQHPNGSTHFRREIECCILEFSSNWNVLF